MMVRIISKVHITSSFTKSFRKLPTLIQDLATRKDQWFRDNAFDSRLKTHKLKGVLEGYWSYSINHQYRILFRFVNPNEVIYPGFCIRNFLATIGSAQFCAGNALVARLDNRSYRNKLRYPPLRADFASAKSGFIMILAHTLFI